MATKPNLFTIFEILIIKDNYKTQIFDKNFALSADFPSHCFIFRVNSDRVLESLISFGNVDHKRQPL